MQTHHGALFEQNAHEMLQATPLRFMPSKRVVHEVPSPRETTMKTHANPQFYGLTCEIKNHLEPAL